jgi:branched-chain amino acid transport system substrate-binding protein
MWQALQQQRIPQTTTVVTGLAQRNSYQTFGPVATGLKLLSHYVYQAPKNPVNDWLVKQMRRFGQVPDIFTPDGFVTAQLIAHAVQKADGDDVGKMISALEGYKFVGPKGPERVRPEDHALLQPMFQVELVKGKNGRYDAKVLKTVSPGNVQPPITPFK